jgi:excisionase family DNA binding protein
VIQAGGHIKPGRRAARDNDVAGSAPKFYSVAQVARMFGMSSMTLYRAISAGEFPAVRVRGRLIVPAKAIEALADAAMAEHSVVNARGTQPTPSPQAEA